MNRLQKITAILFFAAATLLFACRDAAVAPIPANQVKLALNQSARLNSGVSVKVDSLNDSRCPINAVCIWGGNVVLRAILTKDSDSKPVRLILGQDLVNPTNKRPDSTGVILTGMTYKVVLREVTPYPGSETPQPSEAVIEVTPL